MAELTKIKGFTLIELLIAVFILEIAFSALLPLVNSSLDLSRVARLRLQGESLAREGIEILRNARDTNELQSLPFNEGFLQDGDYKVETSNGVSWKISRIGASNPETFLPIYLSSAKIFNHDVAGSLTSFSRAIRIKNLPDSTNPSNVSIISEVVMDDGKFKRKVSMETLLYDWR